MWNFSRNIIFLNQVCVSKTIEKFIKYSETLSVGLEKRANSIIMLENNCQSYSINFDQCFAKSGLKLEKYLWINYISFSLHSKHLHHVTFLSKFTYELFTELSSTIILEKNILKCWDLGLVNILNDLINNVWAAYKFLLYKSPIN